MSTTAYIKLYDIGESLKPGDAIKCTINGDLNPCEFVRYGPTERFVWVRIHGFIEVKNGMLSRQIPMFDPAEFVTEFTVNHAPGRPWHRTAGMSAGVVE